MVNSHNPRYVRMRYSAAGALAALIAAGALAAVGAFAGTTGTAGKPPVRVTGPAQTVPEPLRSAIQQLVDNGTITAAQGQTVDADIEAGTAHPDQLAAQAFTQSQIDAIEQALRNTKVRLAQGAHGLKATPTVRRKHRRRQPHTSNRHP